MSDEETMRLVANGTFAWGILVAALVEQARDINFPHEIIHQFLDRLETECGKVLEGPVRDHVLRMLAATRGGIPGND